jgi:hypothetical protein
MNIGTERGVVIFARLDAGVAPVEEPVEAAPVEEVPVETSEPVSV